MLLYSKHILIQQGKTSDNQSNPHKPKYIVPALPGRNYFY